MKKAVVIAAIELYGFRQRSFGRDYWWIVYL